MADKIKSSRLIRRFAAGADAVDLTQGLTFLRLIPHEFEPALRYIKTKRSGHTSSLSINRDRLENALLSYVEAEAKPHFADQRKSIIHDVSELAKLYSETHEAEEFLINIHADFERLQPFSMHGGLRLIYDTIPSEDGWAVFRMDGLTAKLSEASICVDISVHSEGHAFDRKAQHDIEFLARLADYTRELSEREYPGASEISPQLIAEVMDVELIDFDQDSAEAQEEIERDEEEGQGRTTHAASSMKSSRWFDVSREK